MATEYVVANTRDLPVGAHILVEIGGREFGVFNVKGEYYALANACFHQNGPLCGGAVTGTTICDEGTNWKTAWDLDGEVIVCPWHSLEFHIPTGRCLAYPNRRVPTYPVRVDGDQIKLILR